MLNDLVTLRPPPPNRKAKCLGELEIHLSEGAVMVAYAMHLLRTLPDTNCVSIHPDGEHAKRFNFRAWLATQDFQLVSPLGSTSFGGTYERSDGKRITVNPKSGIGDVVLETANHRIVAECKGGVINTKHAGQSSRLRQGLCEIIGLLMATPSDPTVRQMAVVPKTDVTQRLAERIQPRASIAGIGISLVDATGNVFEV